MLMANMWMDRDMISTVENKEGDLKNASKRRQPIVNINLSYQRIHTETYSHCIDTLHSIWVYRVYTYILHVRRIADRKPYFFLLWWAFSLMTAFGFGTLFANGTSFILHLVYLQWDEMRCDLIRITLKSHHNAQCTCMLIAVDVAAVVDIIMITVIVVCIQTDFFLLLLLPPIAN